jgi:hypothetical protein
MYIVHICLARNLHYYFMALENQIPDNGDEISARRYLLSIGPIVCFLLVLCTTGGGSLLVLSQMNISSYQFSAK